MIIPRILGGVLAIAGPIFAELKKAQSGPCSWDTSLPSWKTEGQDVLGFPFCSEYWAEGDTITGLTTYSNDHFNIIGIDIDFASGRKSAHYGEPNTESFFRDGGGPFFVGPSGNITLKPGEFITAVKLYPVVFGDVMAGSDKVRTLSAMKITTTSGRTVEFGWKQAIQPGVGYSVSQGGPRPLLGISGTSSDKTIGMLRFHFHKSKITEMKVSNYTFGFDSNKQLAGPRFDLQDVASGTWINDAPPSARDIKFGVTKQEKYTVTNSVSQQHESKLGVGISMSYEISTPEVPLFPKVTAKYGIDTTWEKRDQTTYTSEWTRELGRTWTFEGQVQPGMAIRCVGQMYNGTARFPYTADTTVTFEDKTTHRWNQKGVYNTVSYSEANTTCTVMSIEEGRKQTDIRNPTGR